MEKNLPQSILGRFIGIDSNDFDVQGLNLEDLEFYVPPIGVARRIRVEDALESVQETPAHAGPIFRYPLLAHFLESFHAPYIPSTLAMDPATEALYNRYHSQPINFIALAKSSKVSRTTMRARYHGRNSDK